MSLIERAARRLEEMRRSPSTAAASQAPESGPRLVSSATVCEIDLERLAASGFVTPDAPRSRLAEEFRILKRPILANVDKGLQRGNLIMVTSALPGEGKTFTSLNLAMSIAMELDRTVLLVDADVPRPGLPSVLGVRTAEGMLDVLAAQSVDLAPVLIPTNVPKLTFLPGGRQYPRATEMLASETMTRLLDDIASRYPDRIVIFDSPPVLVTTEARVLATHMGQIVFVVRAEATPQADVRQALATIELCPVKMLVLNEARTAAQGAYGYGYGYGSGSRD